MQKIYIYYLVAKMLLFEWSVRPKANSAEV